MPKITAKETIETIASVPVTQVVQVIVVHLTQKGAVPVPLILEISSRWQMEARNFPREVAADPQAVLEHVLTPPLPLARRAQTVVGVALEMQGCAEMAAGAEEPPTKWRVA